MGDFSLMFGAKGADGATPTADPKDKSNKLWPWGTAPAQLLNACGSNHLSEADLISFWKVLSQGNKTVPFFFEGVDDDPLRQAVGVSRAVGALQSFVSDVLSTPHVQNVIKEPMYKSAIKEATDLLAHLKILNAGGLPMPGSKAKDDRTAMFKRQRTEFPVPEKSSIESAATALFTWINKKPSDLKLLIMIFGSNGLSHNAQVYEKCLRAHVDHRKMDKDAFVSMMALRFEGVKASAPSGAGDLSEFKG